MKKVFFAAAMAAMFGMAACNNAGKAAEETADTLQQTVEAAASEATDELGEAIEGLAEETADAACDAVQEVVNA